MAASSFAHTANYRYIDLALRSRWISFIVLEDEMSKFTPKPMAHFDSYKNEEIKRLCQLNPNTHVSELEQLVQQQVDFLASAKMQFHEKFDQRHMSEYVAVVMLAHSLSEALINAVLAIGLAHIGSVELFPLIEKADFKQKWLVGPKTFEPAYTFPVGTALHETLIQLNKQRNALVHHKIELQVNGTKVLEGSDFTRAAYSEEVRWIRRFFSLPYDLSHLFRRLVHRLPLVLLMDRAPIEPVEIHQVV